MQLHDFMCPNPVKVNSRYNLADMVKNHSSALFMGIDFMEDKIYSKNGVFPFEDAKDKTIFGKYKPWPQHTFFDQMKLLINQPVQILSDFEDCRGVLQQVLLNKKNANVFCYNRKRGIGEEILWQRAGFFEPNDRLGFSSSGRVVDSLSFSDKINKIYWRGGLNGSNWINNRNRDSILGLQNSEEFFKARHRYSRIEAVLYSQSNPHFTDFKLTGEAAKKLLVPEYNSLFSAPVDREVMLQHKYILCPNGNDVSTQFYWVIGTNSVAFKEDCEYEIVPDFYLKPWVHYVPIAKGLADLKEKFEFLEKNPSLSLEIIENANVAYEKIIDGKEWKEAELIVLQKLGYIK